MESASQVALEWKAMTVSTKSQAQTTVVWVKSWFEQVVVEVMRQEDTSVCER